MNNLILHQKFVNQRRRKKTLRNDTLHEELFQNDLAEELMIENSNSVINLAATLGALEHKPPRKERRENKSRENRKQFGKNCTIKRLKTNL